MVDGISSAVVDSPANGPDEVTSDVASIDLLVEVAVELELPEDTLPAEFSVSVILYPYRLLCDVSLVSLERSRCAVHMIYRINVPG